MSLKPGYHLGPYEIIVQIGAGGMGEVYRARDTKLNRFVAIKILPSAFADDADRLRRFELEAQTAGGLNHPNIVAVYDFGRHDQAVYVATELLEGETLRQRIISPIPVRRGLEYAIQTARGLAAAHAKGITHRDIKPENLFITSEGFVKILDFGLAKLTTSNATEKTSAPTMPLETDPGVVMGTAGYMSPEQIRGGAIDPRSDIFSLGAVLYEMLASKRAFSGGTSIETMSAILKEEPADLPDSVPPALDRIVRRCLEKKPEQRFESARDLAFALESISSASGKEKPIPRGPSHRKRLWIGWAAAVVIAVGITAFFAGRSSQPESSLRFHALTFRRGFIITAHVANDGKTVVYSAAWDGKPQELFSTQESSPESRPLGIKNAYPVAISKKGEIALILSADPRVTESAGTLARVPVSGGAPREVLDDVFEADWSPDGANFAVVRGAPSGQVVEYPIGNKVYETLGFIQFLSVSPKGDLIALVDAPLSGDYVGSPVIIDTHGNKKSVPQGRWVMDGLGWSPDQSGVLFAAWQNGASSTSIYKLDLHGSVRRLQELPGQYLLTDVAPDGRLLLIYQTPINAMPFRRAGASAETNLY